MRRLNTSGAHRDAVARPIYRPHRRARPREPGSACRVTGSAGYGADPEPGGRAAAGRPVVARRATAPALSRPKHPPAGSSRPTPPPNCAAPPGFSRCSVSKRRRTAVTSRRDVRGAGPLAGPATGCSRRPVVGDLWHCALPGEAAAVFIPTICPV